MKIRALLAASTLAVSLFAVASSQPVNAAAKQKVKILLSGDCADGEMIEGTDEEDCEIMVSVTPRSAKRSAILEVAYDSEDPEWEEIDSGKTKSGRLIFDVPSTDEDDEYTNGIVMYRVVVKKSGANKAVRGKEYSIEYTSAEAAANSDELLDDLGTEDDEEKAFEDDMDKKQSDNQRNINNQQPNQNIGSEKSKNDQQMTPPTKEQRAGEMNKACGSLGISQETCKKVIEARSGTEAMAALGSNAERFCQALLKLPCREIMPIIFK
jgi:hypothetical protein